MKQKPLLLLSGLQVSWEVLPGTADFRWTHACICCPLAGRLGTYCLTAAMKITGHMPIIIQQGCQRVRMLQSILEPRFRTGSPLLLIKAGGYGCSTSRCREIVFPLMVGFTLQRVMETVRGTSKERFPSCYRIIQKYDFESYMRW